MRALAKVALTALVMAACARPAAEKAHPALVRLEGVFPVHAAEIARSALPLRTTSEFGQPRRLSLEHPTTAAAPLVLRAETFSVRVRELGATSVSDADNATVYGRGDVTSYWVETERGHEEWLLVERLPDGSGREALVGEWEVTDATLRLAAGRVELLDARGVSRIEVSAPIAYTRTGRALSPRLAIAGARIQLWVEATVEELPLLVDPIWTLTGSMGSGRNRHTATLLANGKVLAVGGDGSPTAATTAELFDPATLMWSPSANLTTPRIAHVASLLPNGKVLVAGGETSQSAPLASADLYDPVANTWTAAPPMWLPRKETSLALLNNGKVLIAGGVSTGYEKTAELYHPATNTWSTAGVMATPRRFPSATTLPNGKVLVVGGSHNGSGQHPCTASAELYDPVTNTWSSAGSMATARCFHGAVFVPLTGKVLVTGGSSEVGSARLITAEWFDPATNVWTAAPPMSAERRSHTAITLVDGRVLVSPAENLTQCEIYDPASNAWTAGPSTNVSHPVGTFTLLTSGRVLAAGGNLLGNSSEVLDPTLSNPCTTNGQCVSGHCVDGVCCDFPCAGACDRCNLPGLVGFCSAATGGTLPTANCGLYLCDGQSLGCPTSCTQDNTCAPAHYCAGNSCQPNGTGAIATACRQNIQCASGHCVGGLCCSSACTGACMACNLAGSEGTCATAPAGTSDPACNGFLCATGSCTTSCASNSDCASTHFCNGSTCSPRKANGLTCSAGNHCLTGNCSDGVCCDTACGLGCDACNLVGKAGTCSVAPAGYVAECAPFACTGFGIGNCLTACLLDSHCIATHHCNPAKQCVPRGTFPLGAACTDKSQCASAFCVDGVCCDGACGGVGLNCLACSVASGAVVNGTCATARSGTVCRPGAIDPTATASCVTSGVCDGVATFCPPMSGFEPATTACRRAADGGPTCNPDEFCTGVGPSCPSDGPSKPMGTVCRPAASECDAPEQCPGQDYDCPGDAKAPDGTLCASDAGACLSGACVGPDGGVIGTGGGAGGAGGSNAGGAGGAGGSGCTANGEACSGAAACCSNNCGAGPGGTMVCRPTSGTGGGVGGTGGGMGSTDGGPTPVPVRNCGCSSGIGPFFLLCLAPLLRRRRSAR